MARTHMAVIFLLGKKSCSSSGGFNPECMGDIWVGDGEAGLLRRIYGRKFKLSMHQMQLFGMSSLPIELHCWKKRRLARFVGLPTRYCRLQDK